MVRLIPRISRQRVSKIAKIFWKEKNHLVKKGTNVLMKLGKGKIDSSKMTSLDMYTRPLEGSKHLNPLCIEL